VGHGGDLHEALLRVPLIIKPAGSRREGERLPGPMQSVDILPTLLELAGVPSPEGVDGLPWGRGRTHTLAWVAPPEHAPPHLRHALRAVREGRFKLVHSPTRGVELYDLLEDPDELTDLAARHPETCKRLLSLLDRIPQSDPGAPEPLSAERLEGLRALGYVQ
jgi:iduronate 2-sulfatase